MSRGDEAADTRPEVSPLPLFCLVGAGLVVLVAACTFYGVRQVRQARDARDAEQAAVARADYQREYRQRVIAREAEAVEKAPPQANPVPVELATVSVRDAERLSGRPVLVTLDLLDNDDGRGAYTVHNNAGPASDGGDVERSVWVPKGKRVPGEGCAVGTLFVIRHRPDRGGDGSAFPGYIELRVVLDD